MKYRFDEIAINSTEKKKPVEEDKNYYLGLEHLDPKQLKVTRYGSEVAPIGEKLIMKKGDVLFGKRRAYQKKVAIAPFDGIFSAHGMVLRPNEEVISKELFPFFISSDYFLDNAIRISVGSLSPTINWGDLRKLEFSLPDKTEQDKIAEVLWAIEENIERYNELLEMTDLLIKSEFYKQFGNGKYNEEALGGYISQIRGVTYKKTDLHSSLNEESVLLLRANNVNSGLINYEEVQFVDKSKVSDGQLIIPGDILMCGSSGSIQHVGKAALCGTNEENNTFGAFMKIIRCNKKLLPEYLATYFMTDKYRFEIEKHVVGTNINNLKNDFIDELKIEIPPLEVQREFIKFVKQAQNSKLETKRALEALKESRKAIIKKYFG